MIKCFVKYRMYDIVSGKTDEMPDSIKYRFLRLYIGESDRTGLNSFQTHAHKVAARLNYLNPTVSITNWLSNVCTAFAHCNYGDFHHWGLNQKPDSPTTSEGWTDDGKVLSTCLVVAIVTNPSDIIPKLLQENIPLEAVNGKWLFAGNVLEMACNWGSVANVQCLLEAGAEPQNSASVPLALKSAITRDYAALVKLLLAKSGSKFLDWQIKGSAVEAARLGKFSALEEFLEDCPALMNQGSSYARNICHYAAWHGRDNIVTRFVEAGACEDGRESGKKQIGRAHV